MNTSPRLAIAAALVTMQLCAVADTFFSDTFSNGSTLNQPSANPTATATSYEMISSKSWNPTPSLAAGDLKYGIASSTSGSIEVQARFGAAPVTLNSVGDFVELTVTFTNTAGLLTAGGSLGFGLYNSSGVSPLSGGLNGTATSGNSANATGGAQSWVGYVGQVSFTGSNSRIMSRAAQTGTDNRNQDLITSGSSSLSYGNPAAASVGSASSTPSLTLVAGQTYTEDLIITLTDVNTLAITNTVYSGTGIAGSPLSQFGAVASGTNFLTGGFDALAVGWRETGSQATTIDISSITVTGQSTVVTTPPSIDVQPTAVSVPSGAAGEFLVSASGFGLSYQWHRYGTNLVNGGNISGATSSMLIISPASAADVASGANGYSVTVTGTGGYTTNSVATSLSLRAASDLTWSGSGNVWDLNTTADWLKGGNPATFNFGDNVTFDDTGAGNSLVNLSGSFLSASTVTVNSGADYIFSGTGNFAGPGKLLYIGPGHLTINNANSYSGGTLISNSSAYLVLNNYNGLGTGPVTLGMAGGQMEIVPAGSASVGINGTVNVADDFTLTYDASSSFGVVFLGDLSGTAGKTLTINYNNSGSGISRFRVYGGNTVFNANLVLNDSRTLWAPYSASGSQTYNGVISGSGAFMQKGTITYLNGANTYTGGTTPATGTIALGSDSTGNPIQSGPLGTGPILLAPDSTTSVTGSGTILAWGGARTIANPIQYPSATNNLTLIIGGTNRLTLTGDVSLNGNDGTGPTNRFLQVTNTALTVISGVINDSGTGCGLIKTGNGILALNSTETYTGPTLISNGVLQVNGQIGSGAVTVATNGALGGTGTVMGPVTVLPGGAIAPGDSIGTLTLNNNLTLSGNLTIEVNKSSSLTSDRIVVNGTLNNSGTGTLTVTNLGSALAVGDTFTIFNKPLPNGSALKVTGGGSSVNWTNRLALDGTISVLSVVATAPTNLTFSVSGGNVVLGWPANYTGWTLEAQTNAPGVGLGTNWVRVAGSSASNQITIPVSSANGSVFFRLVYP